MENLQVSIYHIWLYCSGISGYIAHDAVVAISLPETGCGLPSVPDSATEVRDSAVGGLCTRQNKQYSGPQINASDHAKLVILRPAVLRAEGPMQPAYSINAVSEFTGPSLCSG